MKVKSIKKCDDTPLTIVQEIPWDKMENCIVLYNLKDDDEVSYVRISSCQLKERVWLTNCLVNVNIADSINTIEDNSNDKTPK